MSQHCRANPCCGDRPCSGIPLPQDASGLPAHNKSTWWRTDIKGVPAYTSSYFNKERWEAEGKTVTRVTDEDRSVLSTSQSDPAPEPNVMGAERLPYDLRLHIGKALDCLVCDDSSPEQVDKFIETFREFGLTISAVKGSTE